VCLIDPTARRMCKELGKLVICRPKEVALSRIEAKNNPEQRGSKTRHDWILTRVAVFSQHRQLQILKDLGLFIGRKESSCVVSSDRATLRQND